MSNPEEMLTEADLGYLPGMIRPSVDQIKRESADAHANRKMALRNLAVLKNQVLAAGGDASLLNEAFELAEQYYCSLPLVHFRTIRGRFISNPTTDFANGRALFAGAAKANPKIGELARAAKP